MKPNRTFPAVPNDLREWTRYLQGLFYARTFTAEMVDGTTASGTARYTVSAGIVCLTLPTLLVTSTAGICFIDNLPEEITPEHDQLCIARIVDNGVTAAGLVQIGTDTGITLFKDLAAGAFTAAGSKGVRGCAITYPLD
jgi:hypothetical protein